MIFLVLVGLIGYATAIHDPNQSLEHSIILPDNMREVSFDDFMEWCVPHFADKCVELEKKRASTIMSPLKQFKSGIATDEIQCKDDLVLVQKYDQSPACVRPETKTKLIERGWAEPVKLSNTLLGKTLDEWRKYSFDELRQIGETDKDFNRELGRLAIKEHMQEQLALNNITNSHDDFKVFSGYSEMFSVDYNSVVNATDGESYLVLGSARFYTVGDYFELRTLTFGSEVYDETQHTYYSENPVIEISPDKNNRSQISNADVIIYLNQTDSVTFQNNLPMTIRIQEFGSDDVDEQENLNWIGPTLQSGMSGNVTFSDPGYYRWSANQPPEPFGLTWYGQGSGHITVVSDNVDDLSFTTKNKMAGSFVKQSKVPWVGFGVGNNKGVVVHLYPAVYYMMHDAGDYYTQYLEESIPFDVPILLVEPKNYDYGQNYENEN